MSLAHFCGQEQLLHHIFYKKLYNFIQFNVARKKKKHYLKKSGKVLNVIIVALISKAGNIC